MTNVNIFNTDLRGKVKKEVPFIKDAWVVFYDDTTVQAVQEAQKAQTTKDIKDNLGIVVSQIAEWNFADDKGLLPITIETLTRFPMKLITWLSETQSELLTPKDEVKKNLPVT